MIKIGETLWEMKSESRQKEISDHSVKKVGSRGEQIKEKSKMD